jgi:hypothetical protein
LHPYTVTAELVAADTTMLGLLAYTSGQTSLVKSSSGALLVLVMYKERNEESLKHIGVASGHWWSVV